MDGFISAPTDTGLRWEADRITRWACRIVLRRLQALAEGELTLEEGDGRHVFGRAMPDDPVRATLRVHRPAFYRDVLLGGSVGAAEAYMRGDWSADRLTDVIRLMVRNQDLLEGMEGGLARAAEPVRRLAHFLRRNTPAGSRRNIRAHYDLGNDFYALFLDETMTYSCGIFEREDSSLRDASTAKYDRICRKLELRPGDRVVEIGGGWGGFALHAARTYGCHVTTTTVSGEQLAFSRERVREAGLQDRIEVLQQDYRHLGGTYDKLVSIEMIEAVGHDYLDTFFRCCSDLLKPDGRMALQAITIRDQVYESHRRSVDFIKQYIFPGSCIPSLAALSDSVARVTDLRIVHLEDITPHYVRTLRSWRERFFARIDRVRAMGFPESFLRMWEFYLCYCEGSFRERYNGNVQMILAKPRCRPAPILPALGAP